MRTPFVGWQCQIAALQSLERRRAVAAVVMAVAALEGGRHAAAERVRSLQLEAEEEK